MGRRAWVYNPHAGGRSIPPDVRRRIESRILRHARKLDPGRRVRIGVRFHGALCYIDAFIEPAAPTAAELRRLGETRKEHLDRLRRTPIHLCRLRYFGDENAWSLAFYTHGRERYEPCFFNGGRSHGTPEAALDLGAAFLDPR